MNMTKGSLIDSEGREKYLSQSEVKRFFEEVNRLRPKPRTYCLTLYFTGARRSEALALRKRDIDIDKKRVAILTLKQRKQKDKSGAIIKQPPKPIWRHVPPAAEYLKMMDLVFDLKRGDGNERLWKVTPRQATRWVKSVMEAVGVGHHSPHTLRHTFAMRAAMMGIPQASIQKWLGHSHATTTSIYTTAGGAEEDELSKRMWET